MLSCVTIIGSMDNALYWEHNEPLSTQLRIIRIGIDIEMASRTTFVKIISSYIKIREQK